MTIIIIWLAVGAGFSLGFLARGRLQTTVLCSRCQAEYLRGGCLLCEGICNNSCKFKGVKHATNKVPVDTSSVRSS